MTSQNSSWDLGRFLKTLSYYGAVPILSNFDWFQQWFGSRPDPKVDGRILVSSAAGPGSAELEPAETGSTGPEPAGETGVWVVGEPALTQPLLAQLAAAGYSPSLEQPSLEQPNLEQADQPTRLRAIVACGPTALDQAQLTQLRAEGFGVVRRPIFEFCQPAPTNFTEIWGALDDVVMGGVSQSGIRFADGMASFEGNVSTANSGGFASVRTRNLEPALDLSAYEGVELRVKGDGQRYKFMLRTETRWDGVAYCCSFDTAAQSDEWQTVRIPFAALVPVFRARTVADSPVDTRHVTAWQLMLSKFEYDGALNPHFRAGQFRLQIASIGVYRPAHQTRLVWINPGEAERFLQTSGIPYRILPDQPDLANAVVAALSES
ncbi:MAG: CIA30 family protein [Elainella sp.]